MRTEVPKVRWSPERRDEKDKGGDSEQIRGRQGSGRGGGRREG